LKPILEQASEASLWKALEFIVLDLNWNKQSYKNEK
jgi:hypothetical protein